MTFISSGPCIIEADTYYAGNTIGSDEGIRVHGDAPSECAKLCAETKVCLFWTYQPKTKGCWVKKAKKKIKMMGVVSGNRECGL